MENCLVTTYKGEVNNDNLPLFAELVFIVKSGNNLFSKSAGYNIHTGPSDAKAGKVWLVGTGAKMYLDQAMQHEVEYMTTKSHESNGEQVCQSFVVSIPSGSTAELHVKSKYNLENFLINAVKIEPYPIENLVYIGESCVNFDLAAGQVTGNLVDIAPRLNVELLRFNNSGSQTHITGDIVDFAKKQVELGRTSGTCLISACYTLTYNGTQCSSGQQYTITYDSSLASGYSIAVS